MRFLVCSLAVWISCLVASATAAIVNVPYSGQLMDGSSPLSGWHQVVVALWDAPVGGSQLHNQSESVLVEQGVFHLELNVDENLFQTHDAMWVGVAVDGALELEPRVHVGAVPYAVRALSANATPPPGIAFATDFPGVTIPAELTWVPVSTVTLNAPAAGFVWLSTAGWWQEGDFTHPDAVSVQFSLGEGTPPPYFQEQVQTGILEYRSWPYAHTTVVPAPAGPHTYTCWVYVNAPGITLSPMPTVHAATMQAMWVPGDYGN